MRILRLDLDTGEEVDLHPYVTVFGGLDPRAHRRAVEQFERIARGDVEGVGGLVEAHGLLIEIDPDRIRSLELSPDADVLVRAEQLPGARLVTTADSSHADRARADKLAAIDAEIARVDGEAARIGAAIERSTSELDAARRSLDEFAITAHEAAVRAVTETEELARRRLEGLGTLDRASGRASEDAARERLVDQLGQLRQRHTGLETLLDEERLGLLQLLEQLEAERAVLDELRAEAIAEAAVEAEPRPDSDPPDPEPTTDQPEPLPDPEVMREVHAAIREVVAGPPEAPMVPSLPAAALADQVAAHRERYREWERGLAERGLDTNVVRERLEAARRVEAAAAEAARPTSVPPEDEREIERLHDLVTDAADKRSSRRPGKDAERVYEELSAELDALLETYGFPTYAAYIMGRTSPTVDPDARRRHEDAKIMVANLERELEETAAAVADDPHGRMLNAERDQLWAAAHEMLGDADEDDIETALRQLTVPGAVTFDAPERLHDLMRRIGVDVSGASTTGRLLEIADAWYTSATDAHRAAADRATADAEAAASAEASHQRGGIHLPGDADPAAEVDPVAEQEALVRRLFERSVRLDAELTAHENEFERHAARIASLEAELVALDDAAGTRLAEPTPADPIGDALAADPTVMAAREQAALTGARLERHRSAVEHVDRLHAAIGEARSAERMLATQRQGLQAERDGLVMADQSDTGAPLAPVEWHLTEEGIGPIEWYLLGRVASLRSVSAAGSVPLVLDDAFRGLPAGEASALCDALARIGETVQVIYLGDEPAVASWAERQGLDLAAVVRPGQPAI